MTRTQRLSLLAAIMGSFVVGSTRRSSTSTT